MDTITSALQEIQATLHASSGLMSANNETILVAVSKAQTPSNMRMAFFAGQHIFAENYLQEALIKQQALKDLPIEWHFIGPIQSNKTQAIAQYFDWVQSVDRLKVAQRLNDARPHHLPPLQICIQVNISEELSKSGVALGALEELVHAVTMLPRLKLRGLMSIPRPSENEVELRAQFRAMRACFDALNLRGYDLDILSMGMSEDFMIAIEEGATMVRIGSAIFGARPLKALDG